VQLCNTRNANYNSIAPPLMGGTDLDQGFIEARQLLRGWVCARDYSCIGDARPCLERDSSSNVRCYAQDLIKYRPNLEEPTLCAAVQFSGGLAPSRARHTSESILRSVQTCGQWWFPDLAHRDVLRSIEL